MKKAIASNHSRSFSLGLFATLALAATSFGQAVITTGDGNGADTYVSNDSNRGPTYVAGLDAALNQRVYWDVRAKLTMLRFDVSDFVPGSLTDASLSLDFTSSNRTRTWTVYGLADSSLDNWDEASTNYNNAPGFQAADPGQYAFDETVWTSLGTWNIAAGAGVQTSDPVALNMDAFLTGNDNGLVSFLFVNDTDSNADWWMRSKEGAATEGLAPTLTLPNAQIVPEPSTYAVLFGTVALLGAVYFRRRKNA